MVNLMAISQVVHLCRMQGGHPTEVHLNKKTLDEIKKFVRTQSKPIPDTRSVIAKLRNEPIPGAPPPGVYYVAGLPAFENDEVAIDVVAIRTLETMNDPNWLRKIQENAAKAAEAQGITDTPWFKPAEDQVTTEDEAIGVNSLMQTDGRPTPTDVLMKSIEEVDTMAEVIVLKVSKKGGDVYMSSTLPKLAAQGYLHKTLMKLIGD